MFKKTLLSAAASIYSFHCFATTYTVTTNNGGSSSGTGTSGNLSYCLTQATNGDAIDLSSIANQTISLSSSLPQISQSISIAGSNVTIDGNSNHQGFVVTSGNVSIQNLTIQNAQSLGGSGGNINGTFAGGGGGAGAGAGGGIFIGPGTSVVLETLSLTSNTAQGGVGGSGLTSGGSPSGNFGGGGGGGGSYNASGGGGTQGGGIGPGGGGGNAAAVAPNGNNGGGVTGGSGGNGSTGSGNAEPGGAGFLQGGGGGGGGTGSSGHNGGQGGAGALFGGGGGGGFGFLENGGNGGSGGEFGGGGGGGTGSQIGGIGGIGGFGAGGGGGSDSLFGTTPSGGSSVFGGGAGGNGSQNPTAAPSIGGGGGGGGSGLGGALFIDKSATLTLKDSISFSGNSVVGGTGGPNGSGASPGNPGGAFGEDIFLSSGGTLVIDISSPFTISSDIESDQGAGGGTGGGLIKKGSSTLTLSGANTYTGTTVVSKGTLALSNESSIGGTGASLTLGGEDSVTLSLLGSSLTFDRLSVAKDTSLLFNIGNSTLTVAGEVIGSPGSTLSSSGEGSLVVETINTPSGTFTISAPISGSQSITFSGSGTTVLSGDNTYTGTTTVSSGIFTVNGTIASPLVIQNSAKLKGTGTVNNSVTIENGGTFSPGNSSGVMLVSGPVDFANGSTFNVDMDSNGVSQVIATGPITIGSNTTLTLTALDGFSQRETIDTVILQGSSLSGTFSTIAQNSPLIHATLAYSANSLLLQFGIAEFSSLGLKGNPLAVGIALDEVALSGNTALDSVVDGFITFTDSEISSALNQMQPSLFKGLTISQENNAVKVRDTLGYRMQNELDRYNCHVVGRESKDQGSCFPQKRKVNVWIDGFGDILRQKSNFYAESSQFGYQNTTTGVVLGVDGNFAKYFYAGALGSYTDSSVNWLDNQGKGNISTGYGGLYLSALSKTFYANAAVLGSWSHFDSHRNIIYPGVREKAKNTHGGSGLLSHLDTGVNLAFQGITVRPFDSFDYLSQSEGTFTETGAGAYNLKVNNNNSILIRNELGMQFAGCMCLSGNSWTLSPKVSWVREVRVKGSQYKAEFVDTDQEFVVTGYFPDRSLISPGVMLSGSILKESCTLDLYYNGVFGDQYSDHSFGGQVRVSF